MHDAETIDRLIVPCLAQWDPPHLHPDVAERPPVSGDEFPAAFLQPSFPVEIDADETQKAP